MEHLDPEGEMFSQPVGFLGHECQILYERDPTGLLHEVDE
jgi:hypothetical protein